MGCCFSNSVYELVKCYGDSEPEKTLWTTRKQLIKEFTKTRNDLTRKLKLQGTESSFCELTISKYSLDLAHVDETETYTWNKEEQEWAYFGWGTLSRI